MIWHLKDTTTVDVTGPYLDVTEVPEPSVLALLVVGTALLRRRR